MNKVFHDNKPVHKDLTSDIDAGLGLGWRILAAIAVPALFVGVCVCGFQIARAVGAFA